MTGTSPKSSEADDVLAARLDWKEPFRLEVLLDDGTATCLAVLTDDLLLSFLGSLNSLLLPSSGP